MSVTSKPGKDSKQAKASQEEGFSEVERAAIKDRAAELKSEARRSKSANKAAADERDVLAKISVMAQPDRAIAERLHAIITETAPELAPKLWYGQPAYARGGKVVCFFRSGQGDKQRYSTFGFAPEAKLDEERGLWATSFALAELTDKAEVAIKKLLRTALG
ncbi:iron chaperone [Salinispora tropica]|uniref:YdhG-like domain-containing protein n=1 Tax=Salinispora tropica (strain ATCC BAA-916 / DSM 44818 / JCM 13857 / NBRC 105044 / CNB-440) TaxID=369723 RepID=A4X6X4_SALTO|nr:DUF1801 domain-containing protein [Salinispora tropica]ABP54624.1 hypothetical protein Strop_2173 [Salinispora tropica CNB-440]